MEDLHKPSLDVGLINTILATVSLLLFSFSSIINFKILESIFLLSLIITSLSVFLTPIYISSMRILKEGDDNPANNIKLTVLSIITANILPAITTTILFIIIYVFNMGIENYNLPLLLAANVLAWLALSFSQLFIPVIIGLFKK